MQGANGGGSFNPQPKAQAEGRSNPLVTCACAALGYRLYEAGSARIKQPKWKEIRLAQTHNTQFPRINA